MTIDQDKEVMAAELVLGTLDRTERAEAQALAEFDKSFATIVHEWEKRLGELSGIIDPIEPPEQTWGRIKARIAGVEPSPELVLPKVEPAPPPEVKPAAKEGADAAAGTAAPVAAAEAAPPAAAVPPARAEKAPVPARSAGAWRSAAILSMLIAAGLAALVVMMKARPEALPEALRPKPKIVRVVNNVEVVAAQPADYVAILQKEPFAPAFILTFDYAKKTVTARAVNAPHEADKSYELWIVSEKSPNPRSLGVIGERQFTVLQSLAGYDASVINRATYVVSLEPRGGSPTGIPTGAFVYTGKLIQATPPAMTQMP